MLLKLTLDHLIRLRSHIGHHSRFLDKKMNSYIIGLKDNIAIHDLEKSWYFLKTFYYNISRCFFFRNSFFFVGTNSNLPREFVNELLTDKFLLKKNNINSFYMIGYIHKKWIGGVLSNWNIVYNFIQMILKYKKGKWVSKRHMRLFKNLKGLWLRDAHPSFPDFIFIIDGNKYAFKESISLDIPVLGIVDSNVNPNLFSLSILGNDDSLENIHFFVSLIENAILQGRLQEQEVFIMYLLTKIKSLII